MFLWIDIVINSLISVRFSFFETLDDRIKNTTHSSKHSMTELNVLGHEESIEMAQKRLSYFLKVGVKYNAKQIMEPYKLAPNKAAYFPVPMCKNSGSNPTA